MPYSVSHWSALGNSLTNQRLRFVLKRKVPPRSKNRKNFSTLMRKSLAKLKCPASWTRMSIDSARIT